MWLVKCMNIFKADLPIKTPMGMNPNTFINDKLARIKPDCNKFEILFSQTKGFVSSSTYAFFLSMRLRVCNGACGMIP